MELEKIKMSEIIQIQKDKYCMFSIIQCAGFDAQIYVFNLENLQKPRNKKGIIGRGMLKGRWVVEHKLYERKEEATKGGKV